MSVLPQTVRLGLVAAGLALAACSSEDHPGPGREEQRPGRSTTPSTDTGPASSPGEPGGARRLTITLDGGTTVPATLRDTAAARALVGRLPVTVRMRDHGGVEKTGRLPSPLPVGDEPAQADPDPGDLGYYAPGNDLVLYYGDQTAFDGIVVLGRLGEGAAARIGQIDGDTTVRVELTP